ncbi:hypothetical protein Vadar_002349 [Vaccinium darrowii]|uniref:Uncharacterized protein n=1 Tax=Vaccinium darrowii TaxID=229202 RepID=A0ACB7Z160_9ERIC|nr:hypothetical protein Vadar_002349 [Vaccinium darrowii]
MHAVVLNYEEDVAAYTVKAATDPRASNRVVIIRPTGNIITQLGLVSSWEEKSGRFLKQTRVPGEDIIKLSETLPYPDNIPVAILHNVFIEGAQMSFELTEDDLEASDLYPDYKYTSINDLLDLCLLNPPNPKLSSFT